MDASSNYLDTLNVWLYWEKLKTSVYALYRICSSISEFTLLIDKIRLETVIHVIGPITHCYTKSQ